METDETVNEELFWEQDIMVWNSSNTTDLLFVSPFSVLFYRSIFIAIYSIIFIVCIVGNVLVLFVTTASARMKTRTYFFLANLAAADLCVGVLCILPNLMMFLYPSWLLGKVMCKLYYFSESFSFCASVLLLAVIALERYIAVMHPLKARSLFTKCRVHIMQVIIWVVAAGYNVPLLIIFDTHTVENTTFCFMHNLLVIDMRSYYTVNFILWYALPLFTICFVYILIGWTLWHSDSLFGFSSMDSGNKAMRGNLISAVRSNKSKIESSSSSSNSNSRYSDDAGSVHGVLRHGTSTKAADSNTMCFCCHGNPDNNSMAGDTKSDTNSGSPYATVEHGVNTTHGHTHTHNHPDLVCWSWHSTNKDSANSTRQNGNFNGVPSSYKRTPLPNSGKSYELTCLNPNCHHQHNCQTSFLRGFYHRHHHVGRKSFADGNESIRSKASGHIHTTMSLRVLNSRRKVVRLLVMVMISFAVCVLPHHVRLLMHYWDVYPESSFEMGFFPPIAFICLYLNSVLNPILYSLFSQSFRRSLKECLRKPWHKWKSFLSRRELVRWRKQQTRMAYRVSKL